LNCPKLCCWCSSGVRGQAPVLAGCGGSAGRLRVMTGGWLVAATAVIGARRRRAVRPAATALSEARSGDQRYQREGGHQSLHGTSPSLRTIDIQFPTPCRRSERGSLAEMIIVLKSSESRAHFSRPAVGGS